MVRSARRAGGKEVRMASPTLHLRRFVPWALALAALALASPVSAAENPRTPAGWTLTPAGIQSTVPIGPGLAGPWGVEISPQGDSALVTSSGTAARFESVERFELGSLDRTGLVAYDGNSGESVFYGVAWSSDGKHAWASGGGQGVIHAYDVTPTGLVAKPDIDAGFYPAGLAFGRTPLGDRLYVADNLGGLP